MDDVVLEIESLSLRRGASHVLKEVSLAIQQGEILMIIGPSGSGKSSLLRCLNRLEIFYAGHILLHGNDITTLPVIELRQRIGMVFQKASIFASTVADNIAYGPRLQHKQISREMILALMQQVALDADFVDRNAEELSGGQEQRLAIARALANQPEILMLDEPTSALDPIATHKIEKTLRKLCDETGLTLIWVSHSIEQARRVADRVLLLEEGRVVKVDTVTAMLDVETGDPHTLAFAQGLEKN